MGTSPRGIIGTARVPFHGLDTPFSHKYEGIRLRPLVTVRSAFVTTDQSPRGPTTGLLLGPSRQRG